LCISLSFKGDVNRSAGLFCRKVRGIGVEEIEDLPRVEISPNR
jgi:hypothetical protein